MGLPMRARQARQSVLDVSVRLMLVAVVGLANLAGAIIVWLLIAWILPSGVIEGTERMRWLNLVWFVAYLVMAAPVALYWGSRRFRMRSGIDGHERQRTERRMVLYGPLRLVTVQGAIWVVAAGLFMVLNLQYSVRLALVTAETILLGGIAVCALSYLLCERVLRRTAARVLDDAPRAGRRFLPGVVVRALLFWALGTAVPVSGVLQASVAAIFYGDISAVQLAIIVLMVGTIGLVSGVLVTVGAARAVADPVNAVRKAMQRVELGDLDVTVAVYDGTEVGQLQAGFNTMVAGLRERERIRDLFGRHVGRDVAKAAAAAGEVRLGGELRRVAVLFIDMVGSTALAANRPPTEVVELLNRFFAVVVEVVEEHGGWINKFEGDAALAVFGAPVGVDDPAGCALAAARELGERLAHELPDVDVGIGVSAGDAVAGNVGDVRRFEYTVIGDPVNEAARVTELAKSVPGRVLAAAAAVELACPEVAAGWTLGDAMTLRGRLEPTRLAVPTLASAGSRRSMTENRAIAGEPAG